MEKITAAADKEQVTSKIIDLLDELQPDVDAVTEYVDALQHLVDAHGSVYADAEAWRDVEDREERADAKDTAIDSLQEFAAAWEALQGLEVPALVEEAAGR